jgi:hypothetical protein
MCIFILLAFCFTKKGESNETSQVQSIIPAGEFNVVDWVGDGR